jgi:hypothetical protein
MTWRIAAEAARLIDERIMAYRNGWSLGPLKGEALLTDCLRLADAAGFKGTDERIAEVRAEGKRAA